MSITDTISLTFKRSPIADFFELLRKYSDEDLASPTRSSVPLLAYWKDPGKRLEELASATGEEISRPASLGFEYTVCVQGGRGEDSHTDLMLIGCDYVG